LRQPASVQNCQFQATVNVDVVAPFIETLPIVCPLTFTGASNIVAVSGTYVPEDDYLYLFNLPAEETQTAPSWYFLLVDAPAQVTGVLANGNNFTNSVERFMFQSLGVQGSFSCLSMYLEGRPSTFGQVQQGSPINYTLVYGQGTVS
jgi:hypothetical protein